MMNERQRVKELEQLSAYLDGQLDETEQRQIESRLASEPELQEMYEGLRNTKLLFSRLRRVRAPRSFTLTPDMVKVRKQKQPFFSSVRWATSLAAILLVVMFGAEYILGGFSSTQSERAVAPMLESVYVQDEAILAEEEPEAKVAEPLIIWGVPASGSGGGGGDIAEGIGGGAEPYIYEESIPIEPSGGGGYPIDTAPTEETMTTRVMDNGEEGDLILGINMDQAGEVVSLSEQPPAKTSTNWLADLTPLRWAEIGLAVVVVAGGILLVVKKKS
ncbi:hypothetical protein JR338_11360 [Chloroflexota bacterium]|nr:hypothetical protein JR338_11360 [Chloroflexota bacterium]